ncbi:hypothetical protein KIN20_009034 [Parelaphostrongylus tenuis]|uniref:Transmembrane protein n=1 Tax=Parelaphostrongylus tenuis TaxID=148309 RepID=A0AAD5MS09_PARTN|nr:hypothetical protein KIN20_009034 [Parelaphostrongylus tenuis]
MTKRWTTVKEYMDAQNELGSCKKEFQDSVSRSFKFGAAAGVPCGLYVAYKHYGFNIRPFAAKSLAVWITTTVCFSCVGIITATYNCLRVKM